MRTKDTFSNPTTALLALVALFMMTGCQSGGPWSSLAWWKKSPDSSSLASRGSYPPPPSSSFSPQSTATAGTGSPGGSGYQGSGSTNPGYSSTAANNSTYPKTPYDGGSYNGGPNASASYDSYTNAQPKQGYYSMDPPGGSGPSPSSGGNFAAGSDYNPNSSYNSAPLGNDGYNDLRTADTRNQAYPSTGSGYQSYQGSSSQGEAPPWESDSGSSSYGSGGPGGYAPSDSPYEKPSSSVPWNEGALRNSAPEHQYSKGGSDRSAPAANYQSQPSNRNSIPSELPASLTQRRGSYSPGSTRQSYSVANADERLGNRDSGGYNGPGNGVDRVDYQQNGSDSRPYPGSQPPTGDQFRGSTSRGNDYQPSGQFQPGF